MLRCSVETRRNGTRTKNVISMTILTSHMPRGPHRSKTLSTQRPRQKGTTKSLHDMSSMIVLAQTEGASSTWLQCQAIGPVIERGPHLMPRRTCAVS